MDVGWISWLLENVPTRLLDALELAALAVIYVVFRMENKKMLMMIKQAKSEADASYAPHAVKGDVQELKSEITNIRDTMTTGFSNISGQISALSNAVISAVSKK